jgi:hypothetical protein
MLQRKKLVVMVAIAVGLIVYMVLRLRSPLVHDKRVPGQQGAQKDLDNAQLRGERDARKDLASGHYILLAMDCLLQGLQSSPSACVGTESKSATLGVTFLRTDVISRQVMSSLNTSLTMPQAPQPSSKSSDPMCSTDVEKLLASNLP